MRFNRKDQAICKLLQLSRELVEWNVVDYEKRKQFGGERSIDSKV